jgi:hypothetical protein
MRSAMSAFGGKADIQQHGIDDLIVLAVVVVGRRDAA